MIAEQVKQAKDMQAAKTDFTTNTHVFLALRSQEKPTENDGKMNTHFDFNLWRPDGLEAVQPKEQDALHPSPCRLVNRSRQLCINPSQHMNSGSPCMSLWKTRKCTSPQKIMEVKQPFGSAASVHQLTNLRVRCRYRGSEGRCTTTPAPARS